MNRTRVWLASRFWLWVTVVVPLRLAQAQDVVVQGNVTMSDSIDSSRGNILKGGIPFVHNFGINNTFIGKFSGNLTMTGEANTGAGVAALQSITSGSFNTGIGVDALSSTITGFNNVASGVQALQNNREGSNNTANGFRALQNNTTGSNNNATGVSALGRNTAGERNTASGFHALASNETGVDNTAFGAIALGSNTTGSDNTAFGFEALAANTTGSFNTASAVRALGNNANGSGNTAVGVDALLNNCVVFACAEGRGSFNTAVGRSALNGNDSGASNTAVGFFALSINRSGDFNTAIGAHADVCSGCINLTNVTAIGAGAIVDASNKIRLGNSLVTVVEGPPYSTISDENQKENFLPVSGEEVLGKIGGLSITSWNYIGHNPKQFRHYGPEGQEFFAAFGHDAIGTVGTPTTINLQDMEGILMIAVQALEKRTEELQALNAQKADLKARLERLERSIGSYVAKKRGGMNPRSTF